MKKLVLSTTIIAIWFLLAACGGGSSKTPPTANSASASLDEDTFIVGSLIGTPGEGGTLSYQITQRPSNGELILDNNSYTYTPTLNYFGADSFSFTVTEDSRTSSPATISLTVIAINDAPISNDSEFQLEEDTNITSELSVTDIDNDLNEINVVMNPSNGSLVINDDNSFTYSPNTNFNGSDSLVFTASDQEYTTAEATISFTVTAVNDAPELPDQNLDIVAGNELVVELNASDVENSELSFNIVKEFDKANILGNIDSNGSFTLDIPNGVHGVDKMELSANDGELDSSVANIQLNIQVPQTEPTLSHYHYEAKSALRVLDVLATDEKILVAANVNGTLGEPDSEDNLRHVIAVHDNQGNFEKAIYFIDQPPIFTMGHLVEENGVVHFISVRNQTAYYMSLTEDYELANEQVIPLPFAINRERKNFDIAYVAGVGFYVIGNDSQINWIDFEGKLRSSNIVDNQTGLEISNFLIRAVTEVDNQILISGGFYACIEDPEICSPAQAIGTFLLKADKSGSGISLTRQLDVYSQDTAFLKDGRLLMQLDGELRLVNTDGTLAWTRTLANEQNGTVTVDSNDNIFWWVVEPFEEIMTASRITAENELVWQTSNPLTVSGSIRPLQTIVDQFGNMYVSYIDSYSSVSTNESTLNLVYIDYSGDLQWNEGFGPSQLSGYTFNKNQYTYLTKDNNFLTIGNTDSFPETSAYLFMAQINIVN
jgi:Bacterial Ig domain